MDKIQNIDDLIKDLQEIKANYGNIKCYNVTFYIEQTSDDNYVVIV